MKIGRKPLDTSGWTVEGLIDFVAKYQARSQRYQRFVDWEDVRQSVWVWVLTGRQEGAQWRPSIERWLAKDPVEWYRIRLALFGAAKAFCEHEKAAQSGYEYEDQAWYDPRNLADLVPLALDPEWDGRAEQTGDDGGRKRQTASREGGNLVAMVIDTRWALEMCGALETAADMDPDSEAFQELLVEMADWLGGDHPNSLGHQRGRRRVMSNAQAAVVLGENEHAVLKDFAKGRGQ